MSNCKNTIEPTVVNIQGVGQIEFQRHTFYEVLEAFVDPRF